MKNNPFSLHVNLDDFLPASESEKAYMVQMRPSTTFFKDGMKRLFRNKIATLSLIIIVLVTLAALIIPDAWGCVGGVESMGLTLIRLVRYLIANSTTTDMNGISYMVSCACVISWLIFLVTGVLSMILFHQREKSSR